MALVRRRAGAERPRPQPVAVLRPHPHPVPRADAQPADRLHGGRRIGLGPALRRHPARGRIRRTAGLNRRRIARRRRIRARVVDVVPGHRPRRRDPGQIQPVSLRVAGARARANTRHRARRPQRRAHGRAPVAPAVARLRLPVIGPRLHVVDKGRNQPGERRRQGGSRKRARNPAGGRVARRRRRRVGRVRSLVPQLVARHGTGGLLPARGHVRVPLRQDQGRRGRRIVVDDLDGHRRRRPPDMLRAVADGDREGLVRLVECVILGHGIVQVQDSFFGAPQRRRVAVLQVVVRAGRIRTASRMVQCDGHAAPYEPIRQREPLARRIARLRDCRFPQRGRRGGAAGKGEVGLLPQGHGVCPNARSHGVVRGRHENLPRDIALSADNGIERNDGLAGPAAGNFDDGGNSIQPDGRAVAARRRHDPDSRVLRHVRVVGRDIGRERRRQGRADERARTADPVLDPQAGERVVAGDWRPRHGRPGAGIPPGRRRPHPHPILAPVDQPGDRLARSRARVGGVGPAGPGVAGQGRVRRHRFGGRVVDVVAGCVHPARAELHIGRIPGQAELAVARRHVQRCRRREIPEAVKTHHTCAGRVGPRAPAVA